VLAEDEYDSSTHPFLASTLWELYCHRSVILKLKRRWKQMAQDLLDQIPKWLKSLWHMENALRNAARNGLILRKDEASAHLAQARRHLEDAMNEAKGLGPATTQQTAAREDTHGGSQT
jgi:hypothetical protein